MAVVAIEGRELTEQELERDFLLARLRLQRARCSNLWGWYHGEQDLPAVDARYRPAYRLLLEIARTPWARLVVDTIAERLHVQGFRSGLLPAANEELEAAAWSVFQTSSLDADEWQVYVEALICGDGYVSVAREEEEPTRVSPESGFEVTHLAAPGNRRAVASALKLCPTTWTGTTWACELYRPEGTYRWLLALESPLDGFLAPVDSAARKEIATLPWEEDDPFFTENALGVVPIVPFENRSTVLGGGVSELEDCIPILRRIDKLTLDKLLTSETASFRQRWATGLEVPRDEDGNPVEPYKAAVDRLWVSEDERTKFGSFEASELGPYLTAIDAEIAALAAISRVPSHYLLQQSLANPPSAESLIASESGLVAKVRERQRRFGEAWERAIRLALAFEGTVSPEASALEVVWADAEMRNPAQVADAAVKLSSVGVPRSAVWEYIGATPEQLAAWEVEAAAADLALATLPPTP